MKKIKDFFQTWGLLIVFVLLLLIAFFLVFSFFHNPKLKEAEEYRLKAQMADRERIAIAGERAAWKEVLKQRDINIEKLNVTLADFQKQLQQNDKQINEIEKQRKALDKYDHYTSSELKKFFSDLR